MIYHGILLLFFGIFAGVTLVQLAVWWGVFARLARYKPATSPPASALPLSVLICARNEAVNLRKNLVSVLEQDYPEFEVLVVDDDSSDDTREVLQRLQVQYARLRVLHNSPKTTPGKKAALARGIAATRYDWLVFTDADCRPAGPEWLRYMAAAVAPGVEIVLGYGPYRAAPGFLNRWIRFETVQTALQYFSFALAGQPYMGVGRNLAWHRAVFERVGGFAGHADIPSGDDDLLVNAAAHAGNTALCLHPAAFVYSEAKNSWHSWWLQKRRHLGAGRKYRPGHQMLLGLLTLTHVLHYFLLIALLFSDFGTISVAFYAIRMASAFFIFWKVLRQFCEEQILIWFPLLDAFLAFYYALLVPRALIRSDYLISWK